jgi:transcription initiation factor IIE alpha subunit
MDAKCPRCAEKGSFDPATQVFSCPSCGTTLDYESYVEEFASINDEKALEYAGKGSPTL